MKNKSILFLGLLLVLFACDNTPKPETDNTTKEPTAPVTVDQAIQLLSDSIAMDENRADLYLRREPLCAPRQGLFRQ